MRGISLAWTGSAEEFEGGRAGDAFWAMRIIGYPGVPTANGPGPTNDIGCGAHTDYGKFLILQMIKDLKILFINLIPLKILHRNQSGEWISAPPISGTFVCNIGDMLKSADLLQWLVLLNLAPRYQQVSSPRYRVCVAYFYETNFDTAVEPLETCIPQVELRSSKELYMGSIWSASS
uniref:Uncharacterized protein n=1 Tax=Quercus lobata TaxID=97700 RepID=A0A7N2M0G8_QUELO